MKKCTVCLTSKDDSDFCRTKANKDGLKCECKSCNNIRILFFRRTKKGLISNIYANQRGSSKRRCHSMPTYTNSELKEWCFSQKKFHELYDNWKSGGYQKMLIPSCDRIDDKVGYSLNNIQLMTWKENKDKGHNDVKSGKLGFSHNPHKKVVQINIETGDIVNIFISTNDASRKTGVCQSSISMCGTGKQNTAGGYRWQYDDENRKLKQEKQRLKRKINRLTK